MSNTQTIAAPPDPRRHTEEELSKLSQSALDALGTASVAKRIQLQTRLLSLQSRKHLSTLTPTLATPQSSPNTSQVSTIPDAVTDANGLDARVLSFALSRSKALASHTLTNLFRMAGVTTFTAREINGETLLGVRFDVFSRSERTFVKPVYVLLELKTVEKDGDNVFVVARHSVPAFLGLAELAKRFLPTKGRQAIEKFVVEIRKRIVRWRRRIDSVQRLKECAVAVQGERWMSKVQEVEWDDEVALVSVKWENGTKARCVVNERGEVVKVVVMDRKEVRMVDVEGGMKGRLEGLANRLGWVDE